MKKGLQEKICAIFQRTVQLTLHIFSTLCASFRKSPTTKKCLEKNEKVDRFWRNIKREKMRKNIESLLLMVLSNLLIPLIPFLIEMQYGESHHLSQRTFIMGATMYCFSIAIFSERRLFNFLIICVGILIVSLYGSYKSTDYITTFFDFKIFLFFSVFITHLFERIIINIFENEKIKTFI